MCGRIFGIIILVIALLLAIFATILPQDKLAGIVYFSRFFDIMIPVLAVGALIKYLFSHKWRTCVTCEASAPKPINKIEIK